MKYIETYGRVLNESSNQPILYSKEEMNGLARTVNNLDDRTATFKIEKNYYYIIMQFKKILFEFPNHVITISMPIEYEPNYRMTINFYKNHRKGSPLPCIISLNSFYSKYDFSSFLLNDFFKGTYQDHTTDLDNETIRQNLNSDRKWIFNNIPYPTNLSLYTKYWNKKIQRDPRIYPLMVKHNMSTKELDKKWSHLGVDFGFLD